MNNYRRLFASSELEPNTSRATELEGLKLLICNAGGEFYTVVNQCTHQASPLEGGRIRNCFISCPLHGARFNLRDGSTTGQLTTTPLTTYPTRVADGYIEVAID